MSLLDTILKIITDIVDLNSLDAGSITFHPETITLTEILKIIMNQFADQAYDKNLKFIFKDNVKDNLITTDIQKLHKLFYHIISNAVKFSFYNKDITITTSIVKPLKKGKGTKKYFKVKIHDEGPGIPPDELPLIYNKFCKL